MPDVATSFGIAQSIGLGLGLLLFIALRARRYHSNLLSAYLPIWLAACIGLAIYSIVERHIAATTVAAVLPIIFLVPTLAALLLRRFIGRR